MPPRAPSQVRVETLAARGRLVLALFVVLALQLLNTRGGQPDLAPMAVSLSYLVYALALLGLVSTGFADGPRWPGATHAIDLALYAVQVFLMGGSARPLLAWFLFLLVTATLRWGWRGALTTGSVAVAVHVGVGVHASEFLRDPDMTPIGFIMLALLMGVMTILVGLVGAYEDWRGTQLARLAAWAGPDPNRPLSLPDEMLEQTALVLESPRTLLIWEEAEEPWTEIAFWHDGAVERLREPPGTFGDVVHPHVAETSFFCRTVAARRPMTFLRSGRGLASWQGLPVDPRLRDRFEIGAMAAWPLRGEDFRGWLFCLDRGGFALQDLNVGEVVADLTAARLSQVYLVRSMRETAVATERLRLARDLHDGVLQTLTGAALQLQTARRQLTTDAGAAEDRLSQVQRIIAAGQNDLRFFINQLGPRRTGESAGAIDLKGRVGELAERVRRQWGVPITVATEPDALQVPDRLVNDVFLLIHEALVNAARHSRASSIQLALLLNSQHLSIAVVDNGQGFPFKGAFSLEELAQQQIGPRTLRERVAALGGSLRLETDELGTRVHLTVPLGEAA
jgi:signal transduction histidine kinase